MSKKCYTKYGKLMLSIVYAPNNIFKTKALPVDSVDDEIRKLVSKMITTMHTEGAVGLGANMVGLLKRIAVVDLRDSSDPKTHVFINPEIIWRSEETQVFEESSLSFPGIAAQIVRPKAIKLTYLDYEGKKQDLEAEGFLATVIQHEVDYLDGKVFLDYLSKLKRDTLLKKMHKYIKMHPPHVHSDSCTHH